MLMIRNLYQILATLHHLRICTDSLKISTDSHSYVLSLLFGKILSSRTYYKGDEIIPVTGGYEFIRNCNTPLYVINHGNACGRMIRPHK